MTVSPSQFGKRTSARWISARGIALAFTVALRAPRAAASTRARSSARHPSSGRPSGRLEPDAQHPHRQRAPRPPGRDGAQVPVVPGGLRRTASFSVVTSKLAPMALARRATASRSLGRYAW